MVQSDLLVHAGKWFWDNYGKNLVESIDKNIKEKWKRFNWPQAEAAYRSHLRKLHGTTKVLTHEIKIQNLYTDVYVSEQISTDIYIEATEYQKQVVDQKSFPISLSRKSIREIVLQKNRLFLLGKPGSGKTTFLKYLTIQACIGKDDRTPIFITIKEWADSKLDLMQFIYLQFEICSFPDPKYFLDQLLSKGKSIILFDGLDEVDLEKRDEIIRQIEFFSKKYFSTNTSICVSCRLGSIEKDFERFSYVEIADFDEKQMNIFARNWFKRESNDLERNRKFALFIQKINETENKGLRELTQTPLLLALLCIVFEETLEFPKRKLDLYMDAVNILLEKWDAKRGIHRQSKQIKLSRRRKESLLSYLATINFESGKFIFEKNAFVKQIDDFFNSLPEDEASNFSGEIILKTIQEHHGIIVQRSQNLYSFSHLTFQQYFTARYIVGNAANGKVLQIIKNYWNNDQWYEVLKMSFEMLDDGTESINYFINHLNWKLMEQKNLRVLFQWSNEKTKNSSLDDVVGRCLYSYLGLIIASSQMINRSSYSARARENLKNFSVYLLGSLEVKENLLEVKENFKQLANIALDLSQRRRLDLVKLKKVSNSIGMRITQQDLDMNWDFGHSDLLLLENILKAWKLLIECQNSTRISNRQDTFDKILLLPSSYHSFYSEE